MAIEPLAELVTLAWPKKEWSDVNDAVDHVIKTHPQSVLRKRLHRDDVLQHGVHTNGSIRLSGGWNLARQHSSSTRRKEIAKRAADARWRKAK